MSEGKPFEFYFSGLMRGSPPQGEWGMRQHARWQNRCFSYYYLERTRGRGSRSLGAYFEGYEQSPDNRKVLLDSGAFTLLMKLRRTGKTLNQKQVDEYLDKYLAYVREWLAGPLRDGLYAFVTLDYTRDPKTVYEVTTRIRKTGLVPMPVWHCSADFTWLEAYMKDKYPLIGIGWIGTKDGMFQDRRARFWSAAFNLAAKYGVDLHGLGISSLHNWRFPWRSADSALWLQQASLGKILITDGPRGLASQVIISPRSTHRNTGSKVHLMDAAVVAIIRKIVEQEGFDFERLQTDWFQRCVFNVKQFQKAAAQRNAEGAWAPVL